MRKEYNDRWNAPLVNPAVTLGEYEANSPKLSDSDLNLMSEFEKMLADNDAKQDEHFRAVVARSVAAQEIKL